MVSLSVVIPAYNEEAALGNVLERCMEVLPGCVTDFDITVINDGSTDRTSVIIEEWREAFPEIIRSIHHPVRTGLASTLEEAYRAGTKDYVVLLHGDGQYPPDILRECMRFIPVHGAVLLTRRRKFYGPWRGFVSWVYRALSRMLFSVDLRDPGCAKCIRRNLIDTTPLLSVGVFAEAERMIRLMRQGERIALVEIESAPRTGGVAQGGTLRLSAEALRDMVRVWWSV